MEKFFIEKIAKFKNQDWFLELESCWGKTVTYGDSFSLKDGICDLDLEYSKGGPSSIPVCIISLKFFKWDDEKSEYSSNPTCVLVVDTDSDIHDFESVSKEYLKLKEIVEVITKGYVEFEDLVEKLEGQGVKFGC